MEKSLRWIRVSVAVVVGVLTQGALFGVSVTRAQEGSAIFGGGKAARPKARPQKRQPVRRKAAAPAPRREEPLTVLWRVYKRTEEGLLAETNPKAIFHAGDQLRFTVTSNYDGYLYVVHQKGQADGAIVVPDSRVRGGENFVKGKQEYALPSAYCNLPNPLNCWYEVLKTPELEHFTLIFTRNLVASLPEGATFTSGVLKKSVLDALLVNSTLRVTTGSRPSSVTSGDIPSGLYSLWITNISTNDNNQIIYRITINKSE